MSAIVNNQKTQQQQQTSPLQPRFIKKKKPAQQQQIQTIDSSEGNTSILAMLKTPIEFKAGEQEAQQLQQQQEGFFNWDKAEEGTESSSEDFLLNRMMDDMKRQKLMELQSQVRSSPSKSIQSLVKQSKGAHVVTEEYFGESKSQRKRESISQSPGDSRSGKDSPYEELSLRGIQQQQPSSYTQHYPYDQHTDIEMMPDVMAQETATVFSQFSRQPVQDERKHQDEPSSDYEDYEELKKRKLDGLKLEILNEQTMHTVNQAVSDSGESDRTPNLFTQAQFDMEQNQRQDPSRRSKSRKRDEERGAKPYQTSTPMQKEKLNDSFPLNHSSNSKSPSKSRNSNQRLTTTKSQSKQQESSQSTSSRQPPTKATSNSSKPTANLASATQKRQFPKYNPMMEDKSHTTTPDTSVSHMQSQKQQQFKTVNAVQEDNQKRSHSNLGGGRKQDHSQTRSKTALQQQHIQRKKSQISDLSQTSTPKQGNQTPQSQASSQQQVSEKSQQIYFKKLQKEVEQAIRLSDQLEKGGLDLEEFKQCFYTLDYLPFMQLEEQDKANSKAKSSTPLDYTYQNTARGLIIQEKEFVYNLWSILNPLNNNYIDNALLYDVLLLLIFNVKSPVTKTAQFLLEYLENMYNEEHIDLESFANYNSGSSLGQKQLYNVEGEDQLSNLDKYLSFNNLWTVDRLAMEFKQIHANKVSQVYSHKPNSGPGRAVSPMAASGTQNPLLLSKALLPDDGRKYKKAIIDDHLSQLTFTPVLSDKTKEIDQQLTQRLLQESQKIHHNRRDVSADAMQKKGSNRDLSASKKNPTSAEQLLNEHDQSAMSNLKRYELLFYRQQLADQKIEKAKENMVSKELEGCTFKPYTTASGSATKSYQNLQRQADQIFRDLSQKIKTQRQKLDYTSTSNNVKEEKELEECTFKPQINPNPNKKLKDQVPKGYYEMINRMRKVNDEKKAFEEKMQKKVTGENYEKLKTMNIKPPKFLDQERKKRKLLMYVDVNITPTKTGRIGIYEGDDVRDLARNFVKAFQLNNGMLQMLTLQLEQHLKAFKEKNGYKQDGGTVFPRSISAQEDGLQVAEEMSNEEDNEEDERDIRNRIIGYNHQVMEEQQEYNIMQQQYQQQNLMFQQHTEVSPSSYKVASMTPQSYSNHKSGGSQRNLGAGGAFMGVSDDEELNNTSELHDFVKQEVQRFDEVDKKQQQHLREQRRDETRMFPTHQKPNQQMRHMLPNAAAANAMFAGYDDESFQYQQQQYRY